MRRILVLENAPKSCGECCLCYKEGDYYFSYRCIVDESPVDYKSRPDWCPLRSLPEKQKHEEEIDYDYGYIDGWNDCIDIMLSEEDNGLKPLPKDENHEYYGCPSCRHIVSSVQNYCENCGQKLDWRNVGEIE